MESPRTLITSKCLALLLLSCLGTTTRAQDEPPKLLVNAAQCLAAKNHLPRSKARTLSLGFLVDVDSYQGEKVLYVVDYMGRGRSKGMVFAIFLAQQSGRQVFNIQNNAKFVRSKDDMEGVNFVEPPLGGTWTQEHLVSAIKQIERQPNFTVSVKELLAPSPLIQCESYADRK